MFKQHKLDIHTLEKQVRDVVNDLGNTIQTLEAQLNSLGLDVCQDTLAKLKKSNQKLGDVAEKVLKRNTDLEQTIKAQAAKIQSLETTISKLKSEMKAQKDAQAKTNDHLQSQINDLKHNMTERSSGIETKMRNIVTVVMAANKFKQGLGNNPPKTKSAK